MTKRTAVKLALLYCVALLSWYSATSCAEMKPLIRTANDIAAAWCEAYYSKQSGITAEQAAQDFCKTEAQLHPWLDLVLAGERDGVAKLGVMKENCK